MIVKQYLTELKKTPELETGVFLIYSFFWVLNIKY